MNSQIEILVRQTLNSLRSAQIDTSVFEVKLLLAEVLDCDIDEVLSYPQDLSVIQQQKFAEFIEQRLANIPADKIIGHKGFYKHEFKVSTAVLSPRPDTEILVEAVIEDIGSKALRVLELGVGSGCVITSVLADCASAQGTGIDVSAEALSIAAENAQKIGVDNRLNLIKADWFAKDFLDKLSGEFEVIISNPPYIATAEIATLDAEVKKYDPMFALDGGKDGLDSYRRIAELMPNLLKDGGRIYLEVGENQAEDVSALFQANGLSEEKILKDLGGIKRCVILKK